MGLSRRSRATISEDAALYREALEQIAGHFLPGDHPKLCYADAVTTLKMIRTESRSALAGCLCVGTPDEEDCPHE